MARHDAIAVHVMAARPPAARQVGGAASAATVHGANAEHAWLASLLDDGGHGDRVAEVVAAMRQRGDRPVTVAKASLDHTPYDDLTGYKARCKYVDVSALTHVLRVVGGSDGVSATHDVTHLPPGVAGLAVVEGTATLGAICKHTMSRGLVPPVVCEAEDFTVGGLVAGLGVQSSSHRRGFFHASIMALEVVTGDGQVLLASQHANRDLFINLPGSFGTLGLITAAILQLIPCHPFVVSRYTLCTTPEQFQSTTASQLGGSEFLEGIAFSLDRLVSVHSNFASAEEVAALRARRADGTAGRGASTVVLDYDPAAPGEPWYHQHVEQAGVLQGVVGMGCEVVSIQPAYAYLFRYQRGIWWLLEAHVGLPALTRTRCGRAMLDRKIMDMATGRAQSRKADLVAGVTTEVVAAAKVRKQRDDLGELTPADMKRCFVTQGFVVRTTKIAAMVRAVAKELAIWPLWVCGGRSVMDPDSCGQASWRRRFPHATELMLFDVGAYGEPMAPTFRSRSSVRALQAVCDMPSVWGMSYMTDDEIEELFDMTAMEALRRKYHAVGAFLPFLDKVKEPAVEGDLPKVACWRWKRARLYTPALRLLALLALLALLVLVVHSLRPLLVADAPHPTPFTPV